jgi:hypothetical protein
MPNEDQQDRATFDSFPDMWVTATTAGRRTPVFRRPGEADPQSEEVFFPSMDGVPQEGCSSRLIRTS